MEDEKAESVTSALSWNTFLSRTSVSSLSCAIFSDRQSQAAHGLDDVIRAVRALNLRRYRYEELAREEMLGEGETYMVEKCVAQKGSVVAVKHLKTSRAPDDKTLRRRLRSVILEVQIMGHPPLRAHPNLPSALGYGWNTRGKLIMPYVVVEYAPLGTLREHVKKFRPHLRDIEILLGDVASGLAALHTCGIVHGDVKLDNVLVFPSWDRPAKALAKVTDFGHALILDDKSRKHDHEPVRYGGTLIYNAPEVGNQDVYPIDRADLPKCDIWAFGLLLWEACIAGEEYLTYLERNGSITDAHGNEARISPADLLKHAKRSITGPSLGPPMFLRVTLHKTIQEDPAKRVPSARSLPLYTRWNAGNLLGLEVDLALHLEPLSPTYEMFRLDNGREISWAHQQQIFLGLKQTYANKLAKENGPIIWQIALCYHTGFGTARCPQSAHEYAQMAKSEGHPVARVFADLLNQREQANSAQPEDTYVARISTLMRSDPTSSEGMPPLVKACFEGNASAVLNLLSDGACLSSSTIDGCSLFHWLFVFQEQTVLDGIVENLRGVLARRLVDIPLCALREIHSQWPLQLLGSPLAVAISVNCLEAVMALLALGADPFSRVYDETQFRPEDPRSQWTGFHVAAKYHCSDILLYLVMHTSPQKQSSLSPLGCVLCFSTSLECLAMHGSDHIKQLDETIRVIRYIQPLAVAAPNGMTALMQAIDFQDYDVVAALLRAEPELAKAPLCSPKNRNVFNLPIHFAAQIAARRDVPETLLIPQLIDTYTRDLSASSPPPRDNMARTPLHLAVTGASSCVTKWILEERIGLLHVEDAWGRTPLHYCDSAANCDLLLNKGANVDHADKHGMTALHRACYLGASELVLCLLEWKPKLDLKNNVYGTVLHCGVISGSVDVVMALVEADTPLNGTDKMGNTAIHVAAKLDRHNILRILMRRGADITIRNLNGRGAKSIAADTGRLGSVGILSILQRGWETRENQKILHYDPEDKRNFRFSNTTKPKGNSAPDFLWDKETVAIEEANKPMDYEDDNDDVDRDGQESYDEREKEMKKLDQIVNTIREEHFPMLRDWHWAVNAIIELVSVCFNETIWQPVLASRITEIMARMAYDLAEIFKRVHPYMEERGEFVIRSDVAWPSIPLEVATRYLNLEDAEQKHLVRTNDEPDQRVGHPDGKNALHRASQDEEIANGHAETLAEDADDPSKNQVQAEKLFIESCCKEARHHRVTSLAVDCVATIVDSTRPRGTFPGRWKSDFEAIILWELKISVLDEGGGLYKSTLFHHFPQLSKHSWQGSASSR
ncbi:ankyrin [Cenococcum geophilum 1.58]|uniref:Ankyrin n=1 Tax=Cenococcum geophilum 1.58 TaxID=794803 RepID=A0ACC8ELH6_9PEZI|nr:ankyrin [Cenococcum geophilum 1.58]